MLLFQGRWQRCVPESGSHSSRSENDVIVTAHPSVPECDVFSKGERHPHAVIVFNKTIFVVVQLYSFNFGHMGPWDLGRSAMRVAYRPVRVCGVRCMRLEESVHVCDTTLIN